MRNQALLNVLLIAFTVVALSPINAAYYKTEILYKEEPIYFHSEIVGTFVFEKYSDDLLLVTAILEKEHFIHVLKKEAECKPQEMINVCGNTHLTEHFSVIVNDQVVDFVQESIKIQKDLIVFTYSVPISPEPIKTVEVKSDYIFDYNDHAVLRVNFEISGQSRIFTLRDKRRKIKLNL